MISFNFVDLAIFAALGVAGMLPMRDVARRYGWGIAVLLYGIFLGAVS